MHLSKNSQIRIVKQLLRSSYIDFDVETCSSVPAINSDRVDWRVSSVQKYVAEYLRKESGKDDIEVVSSDDDDDRHRR